MAAQYDQLGNYLGDFETEEERLQREREQANRTVQTQEVKTYGDGTVEETTKRELSPAQTSPVRPAVIQTQAMPVAQPMSPDLFNRMLQAESNNRQFTPSGQVLTSPKGAMGIAQIMPATAMQPGYGVPSIFDLAQQRGIQVGNRDEATARQLLANEQLNREFGQNYATAMQQRFGEQGGVAAYNAGPGRIARNMQANQGAMNVGQLPQETQQYLARVQPQASTDANTQRQLQVANQQIQQNQQNQQQKSIVNRFVDLQDDDIGLIAVKNNDNATEFEKRWAGDRLYDRMRQSYDEAQAKQQAKQLVTAAGAGDRQASNTLAKELQKQEGSWVKMILLGFISPQMAGEEAVKLGYGNKWTQGYDSEGKNALIQVNAFGKPLKGFTADGNAIADNDLAAYMTGGKTGGLKADVSTQDVERNGQAGRVVTYNLPNGKTRTVVESGGQTFPYDSSWKSRDISKSAAKADYALITDLKKKHGINVLDAEKDYVTLNGPFKSPEERQEFRRVYGFDLAQPAAGQQVQGAPAGQQVQGAPAMAPAPANARAPGTQVQRLPAGGLVQAAPPSNITVPLQQQRDEAEARKAGSKEIITEAAKQVAASADTQNMLNSINKVTGIIDSGEHNIGSALSGFVGRGPIAQAIGSQFETQDARNTKTIMDIVNKLAADGLKTLGSNPSTVDLEFWTKFKPDASSDPEFVKEWIQSRSDDLKRRIGYAERQVGASGGAGGAPAVESKKEAPVKKLSREEQQAVEWLRKNPDHPKAPQIRRELGL